MTRSGGSRGRRRGDGRRLGIGLRQGRAGVGRVVVVERGLVGDGASSRAAGIVRAQGGTPATVALGRWSIDFYNGQQAAYGTDSGFRELGYVILAVTEEDERGGPRAGRDAAASRTRRDAGSMPPRPPRSPSPSSPTAIAAAATSRPTARSTRRATSGPIRWRCRPPASSSASGPRSPACAPCRRGRRHAGRRRRDRRPAPSRPSACC